MLTLNGPGLKIGMKWNTVDIFGTKNIIGGVTLNRHTIFWIRKYMFSMTLENFYLYKLDSNSTNLP
jgi:hypothetical protein